MQAANGGGYSIEASAPVRVTPPGSLLSTFFLALLVLLAFGGVVFVRVPTTIEMSGWLAPADGEIQLRVPGQARVVEIAVREGEEVVGGQVLAVLSPDRASITGLNANENALASLSQQIAIIDGRVVEIEQQNRNQREAWEIRIAAMRADLEDAAELFRLQEELIALARRQYDSMAALVARGSGAQTTLDDRYAAFLLAQREALELENTQRSLETSIQELSLQSAASGHETQALLHQLRQERAVLEQRHAEILVEREYSILAPASGVVGTIPNREGDSVTAGDLLLTVLPGNSELQAHILASSELIGAIHTGQEVRLRYEAFPYQRFGEQAGEIVHISGSATSAEAISSPIDFQGSVYRTIVQLQDGAIVDGSSFIPLQAGMLVTARAVTGEVTVLQMLLGR